MSTAQRLVKSTSYLTASRLVGDLIYFTFYVLLSRTFGREGIGLYSFAVELGGTLAILADYGLSAYLVRELSRRREQLLQFLGTFLLLKAAFTVVLVAGLAAIAPLLGLDARGRIILLTIAAAHGLYSFGELFRGAFAVHERLNEVAFLDLLYKGGLWILGSAALALRWPLEQVLLVFPASAALALLVLATMTLRRIGRPVLRLDWSIVKDVGAAPVPFLLSALLMDLNFSLAIILVNLLKGEAACGVFAVACKLVGAMTIPALFYRMAVFPALSRAYRESAREHRQLYEQSIRYLLLAFVPAAGVVLMGAPLLVRAVFGAEFAASGIVLQIMSPLLILMTLRQLLVALLGSIDAQRRLAAYQGLSVLTSLVAGILLVPRWGATGAAAALGLSELVTVVLAFRLAAQAVAPLDWPRLLTKPLAASAVTGVVVGALRAAPLAVVLAAAVAACVTTLLSVGGVTWQELVIVRDALVPGFRRVS